MIHLHRALAVLLLTVGVASSCRADAILYNAPLLDGSVVAGTISQPPWSPSTPAGAQYYSFAAAAGDTFNISGSRLDGGYDMSLWVFKGLLTDTNQVANFYDIPGAAFADDQLPPNVPGPYG